MELQPIYETRNEIFRDMSKEEFNNLFREYYRGEVRLIPLLLEYGLGDVVKKFTARLPEIQSDIFCPHCLVEKMISKGVERGTGGEFVMKMDLYCKECGHIEHEAKLCKCYHCQRAFTLAIINDSVSKSEHTKNRYDYYISSPRSKILLGAFLRSGQDENNIRLILPRYTIKQHLLSPNEHYSEAIISELFNDGWLCFDKSTPENSITIENGKIKSYNPLKAHYRLNTNEDDSFINEISNPNLVLTTNYKINFEMGITYDEALELWNEIAYSEVVAYLEYQLQQYRFTVNIGEKTKSVLMEGLKIFSIAQMTNLIWGTVKDIASAYQKGGITKKHAVNYIPSSIQRKIEKTLTEGWEIKGYGRNFDLPQSLLSEIFFNKIIKIGDKGFTTCPNLKKKG